MMERDTRNQTQVLVVDDEQPIRQIVRGILEDAGYDVAEAADGLAALEHMRADDTPRVVLLDLRMPRLDGGGVLRAVAGDRALAGHHALILMTANLPSLTPPLADLLNQLEVSVLAKPFDLDDLLDTVERAERRLRRG
jgi:CheY-like chemotaxis protein